MTDTLVRVENVSKKFCRSLRLSMRYGLQDLGYELLGRSHGGDDELRRDEFWAVNGISFELRRGECLGLIGRNGAGKTTLLRMLNGLIKPDRGRIEIRGRVGALIALGAGFNPILTGRENIYVNGAVLGISKREIDKKIEEIIDFSEISEFIDAPVQSYSSGMNVRLGFSIAVKLIRPDVLLLDEVLAVGDQGFRAKCYEAVSHLLKDSAVIFVSHQMPVVQRICTKAMVLTRGEYTYQGDVISGIEHYFQLFDDESAVTRRSLGNGGAVVTGVELLNEYGNEVSELEHGRPFKLRLDTTIVPEHLNYDVSVTFMTGAQDIVAQFHSRYSGSSLINDGKRQTLEIAIDAQLLNPGRYFVNLVISDPGTLAPLCWEVGLIGFTVRGAFLGGAPVQFLGHLTSY